MPVLSSGLQPPPWEEQLMPPGTSRAQSSLSSVIGIGPQELTLLGIEKYLQKTNKASRNDPAAYLRAEEDYVKHILSIMASPIGNSFEESQRTYASKVSHSVPKICPVSRPVLTSKTPL